jgi:O-antigen/teichoic acid export membrane protein
MNPGNNPAHYQLHLTRKMLLIMLPIILVLVCFSKYILGLAGGDSFIKYSYVMVGLGLIYIVMTVAYPVRMLLRAKSYDKEFFIGNFLVVLFSLSASPYLIKNFELYGVLLGLLSTQLIALAYWSWVLRIKGKARLIAK